MVNTNNMVFYKIYQRFVEQQAPDYQQFGDESYKDAIGCFYTCHVYIEL